MAVTLGGHAEVILRLIDWRYRARLSGSQPVRARADLAGSDPEFGTHLRRLTPVRCATTASARDIEPGRRKSRRSPSSATHGGGIDAEQGAVHRPARESPGLSHRQSGVEPTARPAIPDARGEVDPVMPSVVVLLICVDNDRLENSTNRGTMALQALLRACVRLVCRAAGPWSRISISATLVRTARGVARVASPRMCMERSTAEAGGSDEHLIGRCATCGVEGAKFCWVQRETSL